MDILAKIGVVAATPLVVQFIMDDLDIKHVIAMLVGAGLSCALALYTNVIPADLIGWVWVLVNGAVAGAMATGGVGLGFKVADRMGGTTVSNTTI